MGHYVSQNLDEVTGVRMLVGRHVRLRILDSTDVEYMRRLRNSPETVREFQSRHFINDARQSAFFESLSASTEHIYFIAETLEASKPFGVYFVRNLDHRNQRGENGVFLDPERRTTGVEAFEAAFLLLKYEFSYLNLQKICAEVLADNARAIRFNHAIGMKQEGLRHRHVFYNDDFHDLLQFSLFRDDFYNRPTPVMRSFLSIYQG